MNLAPRQAMAAITIFFLGSLDAVRLSRSTGIEVGPDDVIDFIQFSIQNSFGVVLTSP